MLVLFETASGYAVFKLLKDKKLKQSENLFEDFTSAETANEIVKLKKFYPFGDMATALDATQSLIENQLSKPLKKVLKKIKKEATEELAVADAKLGSLIKDEFEIQCVANSNVNELMRCIRSQLTNLVGERDLEAMRLGLAHSLSRYRVKFAPEKMDTMIVQAISTLDEVDKEVNNYHMRAREWYSWHFPELPKVVTDHEAFIKTVIRLGNKQNAAAIDLSDILPEEVEAEVKSVAEISMGTEISEDDLKVILYLCQQIVELVQYRASLYEYLKNRMVTIAPNLTITVGELVGARLVSHAGSLMSLAKHPASTVQILGAEKALFRALKSKSDTPKYGLIYHASLVGQTGPKNKGKMSRMLAAKAALAARVDALGDTACDLGIRMRAKLESRLKQLENKSVHRLSGRGKETRTPQRYENTSEVRTYNTAADSSLPTVSRKRTAEERDTSDIASPPQKKIKKEKVKIEPVSESDATEPSFVDDPEKKKKKKKKKKHQEEEEESAAEVTPSKKVKRESEGPGPSGDADPNVSVGEKKKKKKKRKSKGDETGSD